MAAAWERQSGEKLSGNMRMQGSLGRLKKDRDLLAGRPGARPDRHTHSEGPLWPLPMDIDGIAEGRMRRQASATTATTPARATVARASRREEGTAREDPPPQCQRHGLRASAAAAASEAPRERGAGCGPWIRRRPAILPDQDTATSSAASSQTNHNPTKSEVGREDIDVMRMIRYGARHAASAHDCCGQAARVPPRPLVMLDSGSDDHVCRLTFGAGLPSTPGGVDGGQHHDA